MRYKTLLFMALTLILSAVSTALAQVGETWN